MCAAKTSKRPARVRIAPHLYRRGGSYEFFRRIPPDARHLFGGVTAKSESFGDVNRREAELLAAVLRKQTDKLIAEARRLPDPTALASLRKSSMRTPTRGEIDRAVRAWVLKQELRTSVVEDHSTAKQTVRDMRIVADLTPVHLREGRQGSLLATGWIADALATANGWSLSDDSSERHYLFDRVGRAQREVAVRVRAELNYEDRPQSTHSTFDEAAYEGDAALASLSSQSPVAIMALFEDYVGEKGPKPKTIKKWSGALRSLIAHLGHEDAARVSPDDMVAWKNALLATDENGVRLRGQGTVRNGYLGAVRAVFEWAFKNRKIASNPVSGITVSVPRRVRTRAEKGFTEAEARIVLSAAFAIDCQTDQTFKGFACRWLPWLCAYTGARVGELAQLRRSDVARTSDGIWFLTITPEAGGQKGSFTRQVALHDHLVEQGFIAAIDAFRDAENGLMEVVRDGNVVGRENVSQAKAPVQSPPLIQSPTSASGFSQPDFAGRDRRYSMYRTRILDGLREQGANFAGHYTIIRIGCGTGCTFNFVADRMTGTVSDLPYGGEEQQMLTLGHSVASNTLNASWFADGVCMVQQASWTGNTFVINGEPISSPDSTCYGS